MIQQQIVLLGREGSIYNKGEQRLHPLQVDLHTARVDNIDNAIYQQGNNYDYMNKQQY